MDTQKWLRLQERASHDAHFQRLRAEYALRDRQLKEALKTMTLRQQDAVTDYIGLLIEMHTTLLLIEEQ